MTAATGQGPVWCWTCSAVQVSPVDCCHGRGHLGERPFDRARVQDALTANGVTTRVRGVLADDARAAGMLAGQAGRERWLERVSPLIRSARGLADDLAGSLPEPASQEVGA
jgi:hypothetical protein